MPSQTATILVTDLVASTELRARLGEEQAERLRRLHLRLLRTSVETHGGVVVKTLGDGVLASFLEANSAVSAAVAVQQAVDAHTRHHPETPLVLRVGLSAGDVTVEEGDRFGAPVIEATRLCAAAEGGQILVAEVVRLLARGRGGHRFTPIGSLDLKGLPEPVTALGVDWQRHRSGSPTLSFPKLLGTGGLAFAGRRSELDLLAMAWKEASAGARSGVVVGGEPGVGKTRLAGEFARRIHDQGAAVLYGRSEEGLGVPYEPFVEALAFFAEHTPADQLRAGLGRYPGELVRLLPDLGDLVPGLDAPLRSDPQTEQYRLFEAVASWLGAAGEAAGLLFVVDDLHWAPPPTLHLLAHVLRVAEPARLLVLATFRDSEVGRTHPLSVVLADLRRVSGIERIPLEGLSLEEVSELLEGLPRGQVDRALAATLHQGTEGNPFFVGEVLRDVAESGLAVESLPVPEGVREVIGSRVARLSASTRELLEVAAVLRDLELEPLASVAGIDEGAAVEALDEALAARLIEETGAGVYRFAHTLVRSTLSGTLSATRQARLHLRAANVFEDGGGGDAAHLAHHLLAAAPLGGPTRTARACVEAGDRALSVLADAEAGDWYAKGLASLPGDEDSRLRMDLLTGLGEAQRRIGDAASRETLLAAARLAADQGEVDRLVRAVLANNRGMSSAIGHVDEERLELIETALERVGPGPTRHRAELLALQAAELLFKSDHRLVLRAADEAADIAASLDDVTTQARVGVRRFLTCLVPDRVGAMVPEAVNVVRLADASGDPQLRALSRSLGMFPLLVTGELDAARRRSADAVAVADETGQPALRSITRFHEAAVVDALGDHPTAERLTQGAFELGQLAAMPDAITWYGARMWLHWTFEGQPDLAAGVAAQGFAEYPRLVTWQGAWALDLALAGHADELNGLLVDLGSILPTIPIDPYWLATHFFFAAAQGFGAANGEAAQTLYDRLLPHRSLHAAYGIGYVGPVEVVLGVLARVLGDCDRALAHHQAAVTTIEACGAARARALNGYQWAVTLLSRGTPGDHQLGIDLAEETLAYCRAKGYTTFVSKTEELLTPP